jgi:hypothetical protein
MLRDFKEKENYLNNGIVIKKPLLKLIINIINYK